MVRGKEIPSYFLFLIVAEAFRTLLAKAFQGGTLEGLEVKPNGLKVSHLQFVDDTLIMCRASEEQLKFLRCVVRCFEAASGMKVNLHMSRIFGISQEDNLDWQNV